MLAREGLTDFALRHSSLVFKLIEENNYPVNPYPQVTSIFSPDGVPLEKFSTEEDLPF